MIGVLALQGDYSKHKEILDKLKLSSCEIRYSHQFNEISGLIIPGGESTTMTDLIDRNGLHKDIYSFSKSKPILGTCAGLIMMARIVNDDRVKPLNILELAGLIKKSSYVISNDTGPAHMAAHLGKSGKVIFGYHTTPKKVSIETENFKAIQKDDLNLLSAEEVYKSIKNDLDLIN